MKIHDPYDLESQERDQEDRAKKSKIERDKELSDLHKVMSSKHGRRVVARILGFSGYMQQTFDTNANLQSFKAGRRDVGLFVFSEVHTACPELYNTMIKELNHGE